MECRAGQSNLTVLQTSRTTSQMGRGAKVPDLNKINGNECKTKKKNKTDVSTERLLIKLAPLGVHTG